MRRFVLAATLIVVATAGPAFAHPLGVPPLAEISAAGTNVRTSLSFALDDTFILMRQAGADPSAFDLTVPGTVASHPGIGSYLTSRYVLSVDEGPCDASVNGGRNMGTGFRFFIDHTCPGPAHQQLHVHNELLRDVSPDYRLLVTAGTGPALRRWFVGPGQTDVTIDPTPPIPSAETEPQPDEPERSGIESGLERLFSFLDEGAGIGAAVLALGIAAALGALHGLTPGHGKTLVAAYLAGSDAKIRHAFGVGAALTITHTAAVLAFGVLALVAGNAFVPQRIEPILQSVAAAMVIGLGLWMLVRRIAALRHPHDHDHAHATDRALSGRGLLAVGAAGGIVPCPEAFGLLFVALTLGRVAAGLMLLVAFSLGLAAVLVAVSVGLVLSRKAIAPRLERSRVVRFLPVVSASLVTTIGVALAWKAAQTF